MKQLKWKQIEFGKKFPPTSGSQSFHFEFLLTFWSHVYFAEQTKSFTLSASPCPCQTSLKKPFQGHGSLPRSCLPESLHGGHVSISKVFCPNSRLLKVRREHFCSHLQHRSRYDNNNSYDFIVCIKHQTESFISINSWILHNNVIQRANILLALQMMCLKFIE